MGQILVRRLENDVIERLKARARANGRSTEAEARAVLSEAVQSPRHTDRVPLAALIGAGGRGRSQEEIDAYIRSLRNEWDR